MPLARADKQPLTTERLREQLGRLGGTPFKLGELRNNLVGDVLLPVSELNRLRREVVTELERLRTQPKRWTLSDCRLPTPISREHARSGVADSASASTRQSRSCRLGEAGAASSDWHLIILVRNLAQLEAALSCGVETLYCEFEDLKKYREAVAAFRARQSQTPINREHATAVGVANSDESRARDESRCRESQIFLAPPRIFKAGEEWTLQQVRSCNADGYLVRNYDHLKFFARDRRIGDYSLNIANRLAADYFKSTYGLERVTASYDLNFQQLEALLQSAPPEWFEVTLHQHMPMFHMEHCLFCAFLSEGTDYTNCGRPCDRHEVRLRDRVGAEHPVKADAGCRNTVFNARAQTGAEYVSKMLALGARHFRIEFLNETPEQVRLTIARYRQLLAGRNHRHPTLARAEAVQSAWCDARAARQRAERRVDCLP